MIYEIKTYVNEEGQQVVEKSPMNTSADVFIKPEYIGTATVETNMGMIPTQFMFPADYTLEKCFEDFKKIADEEIGKQIKAAQEAAREDNLIVTPDQLRNQGN